MPDQGYSINDVAQIAFNEGFRGQSLAIMTAIAMAESGGRPGAMGDVGLETSQWGPSVGLWQIRSLKSQTGSGGVRDQNANTDPATNAKHAFSISGGGKNFQAWSTYTNGAYAKFLTLAQQAANNISGSNVVAPLDGSTGDGTTQQQDDPHSIGTQLKYFDMIMNGMHNDASRTPTGEVVSQ